MGNTVTAAQIVAVKITGVKPNESYNLEDTSFLADYNIPSECPLHIKVWFPRD